MATDTAKQTPTTTNTELSDGEVVRQVLAGKRELFQVLVSRYKGQVFSMILRQVGDHAVADDLAQETFVKAYLNLKSFRYEAKLSTWLVRIALNTTNSYFSSRRFKESQRTKVLTDLTPAGTSQSPEQLAERQSALELFRSAIAGLKPKFREVIVLCGLEGKSYEEAALVLGVPIGTVRSRLNTARLTLKNELDPETIRSLRHE